MPFLKIKSVRKPIFVCCKTCRHGKHGTKTLSLRVHCSVRYQSVYATRWYDVGPWELVATRRQGFPSCPPQATRACCRLRPILGRLDRRLSGIEVLSRYLLLWQVDAGGSRWPPTSSHSSTRWEGQPGDCVSRNNYLHFADIRKGLSLCLWRRFEWKDQHQVNLGLASRETATYRCNRMKKVQTKKQGNWITF